MSDVSVETANGKTRISCPYDPAWINAVHDELNGRFDGAAKQWVVDARDEERARSRLREIYGTDGDDGADTVDVRVEIPGSRDREMRRFSRRLAYRPGRDEKVRLGKGVVLISGGFAEGAGSMKYPELGVLSGTVLEVRDVPRPAAEAARDEDPEGIEILDRQDGDPRAELEAKAAGLRAQLAAVEAELAALDAQ